MVDRAGGGRASAVLLLAALLAGCQRTAGPPPRANDRISVAPQPSLLAVPVDADLGALSKLLERELPQRLWRIDKPDETCAAPKKLDLGIAKLKTPAVKCRITASLNRGAITVGGAGETIRAIIPLRAAVRVQGPAGLYETATARALARATIRLTFARDWTPRGTVQLDYDWTDAPHVALLGQRIELTEPADRRLRPLIAKLERELPGELGKLGVRAAIADAWSSAFATVSLNAAAPPVWMRITPQALQYGGYAVDRGRLRLRLGMRALTETHVGPRPAPPAPTPLPPLEPLASRPGDVAFFIPVFADYKVLEPVLMNALRRRALRPFDVPGLDPVRARFDRVQIYGTTGGRIAVGLTFVATQEGDDQPTSGTVWMTGRPVTQPGSRRVGFTDLKVSGTSDMVGGDLILDLANAPGMTTMVATMLAQNFERDYAQLIGKIDRAIGAREEGGLLLRADLTEARTGQLQAAGQGLYLPVWARGTVAVSLSPAIAQVTRR